jgi:hypothetical protein
MSMKYVVLVAGNLCLDIHPDLSHDSDRPFEEIFLPSRLITCGLVFYSSGGTVANTGLALDQE